LNNLEENVQKEIKSTEEYKKIRIDLRKETVFYIIK
jgi:hypothetical protein